MTEAQYVPGLAGVPAARSRVCFIGGEAGKLQYRGYPIEQLSERCSFEEVTYLLLFGELPKRSELERFQEQLVQERALDPRLIRMLACLPDSGHAMDALTCAVAALGMFESGDHVTDREYRERCAVRLVAKLPTLVASWHRIRSGQAPIDPRNDLGHAANFLYMLDGQERSGLINHVFDVALTLHAEHSMNASTFAARVTGSTLADPFAVIASAIGALSGPLHGGANEQVLSMLETIPSTDASEVRSWAEQRLARKDKVSGFGHRVYKVKDPRATILQSLVSQVFAEHGSTPMYDTAVTLEQQMNELVGHKGIYPNVDFYSGIVYEKIGIPKVLFTPVFAIARVSGWLAHLLEQLEDNRIFRPTQVWTGEADRNVVPLDERG